MNQMCLCKFKLFLIVTNPKRLVIWLYSFSSTLQGVLVLWYAALLFLFTLNTLIVSFPDTDSCFQIHQVAKTCIQVDADVATYVN